MLSFNRLVCLRQGEAPPSRRPRAFALEPFLDAGVVVGCGSHLLSGVELRLIVRSGERGQIALAKIDAKNLRKVCWDRVAGLNGERHEQIEAVPRPVIPEFRPADGGSLLEPGDMPLPALIGQHEPAREGVDAHLTGGFESEIAPRDVGHRGRDIVGRLVQPFEAFPGPPGLQGLDVLVPFRPESFVGRTHLTEHTAR